MSLLDIQDLAVQFNTDTGVVYAVDHVNLTLEEGESLGLVGETGAGKTTTALAVLRFTDGVRRGAQQFDTIFGQSPIFV